MDLFDWVKSKIDEFLWKHKKFSIALAIILILIALFG